MLNALSPASAKHVSMLVTAASLAAAKQLQAMHLSLFVKWMWRTQLLVGLSFVSSWCPIISNFKYFQQVAHEYGAGWHYVANNIK